MKLSPLSKLVMISSVGGALEMYDFVIYIYLVPFLTQIFFHTNSVFLSYMASFTVFGIGYVVRPLGGIVLGHIGDKFGRRPTFILSITLMCIPVLLTALLPTPAQIGAISVVLFVLFRILQGLAVGGEIAGAMAFVNEHTPSHRHGLVSGFIFGGLNIGITFAALVIAFLTSFLSSEQLLSFGWRIPFFLGAAIGIVAIFLRRKTQESPLFLEIQRMKKIEAFPLKKVLNYPLVLLRGIGLTAMGAVLIVIGFTYMNSYLLTVLHQPHNITWFVVLATFVSACLQPVFGGWSDKVGPVKLLRIGAVLMLLLAYPTYMLLSHQHFWLGLSLITFLGGIIIGIYPSLLIRLFPTPLRCSGYALSYNISFAIFGGFSPLFVTLLIHETNSVLSPAICLIIGALLGLISLYRLQIKTLD